jgi:hypothetical protein
MLFFTTFSQCPRRLSPCGPDTTVSPQPARTVPGTTTCCHRRATRDLVSLVYCSEADHDAVIESLRPPIGEPNDYAPVAAAQFLKERLDAMALGR